MSTIIALYVASVKEFVRDRAAIFWTLAFPVLFIVLFGVIFSGNSSPSYTVALVNQDGGPVSAKLAYVFEHEVKPFKVTTATYASAINDLKKGNIDLVIVLPPGMSQTVAAGHTAQVAMYFDPTKDQTSAQIEQTIVAQVLDGYNRAASPTAPQLALATNSDHLAHPAHD